jgi:hypothetical protein
MHLHKIVTGPGFTAGQSGSLDFETPGLDDGKVIKLSPDPGFSVFLPDPGFF